MTLVVDASVAVEALTASGSAGFALQDRLGEVDCIAPQLVDAEVGHVLRRHVAAGLLEASSAWAALARVDALYSQLIPHRLLAHGAWALRHDLSYYDALYAALAAQFGVPLLTRDVRLAAAPGLPCSVEVIR